MAVLRRPMGWPVEASAHAQQQILRRPDDSYKRFCGAPVERHQVVLSAELKRTPGIDVGQTLFAAASTTAASGTCRRGSCGV